ncbi:TIR domain-containing protein [Paraburkholderia sp. GV068]|uniref:toll/interleukin-1 receptor domain-containing protein n=1 Tax=unclassified Paraburkholderia TaxID=2615204 RepID=UPI000D2FF326|nr:MULTISPECIES: toll/interleukin-1 receptor domain-containing protein [unclassified Paraburkholderia]PTR00277.1 TIR domain-containing protein [Paraburkholderia sp. GV072]PUB05125.1 TIR domain-containing protein [Paraburkholderia sp. GV068]
MALYELAVLGTPTTRQAEELQGVVSKVVDSFGMTLGNEVGWSVCPDAFAPPSNLAAAAVVYGGAEALKQDVAPLLRRGVPILPVASELTRVREEIPEALRQLNCIAYGAAGAQRVAVALLECAGLLPKQRRVFVSYRRNESREVALQLFDELSARQFDVFLDTHDIRPAEDFQAMLWHRLCDSDVLVMLDTPGYFESRWTNAEFGRALAKGISVLRIGWPDQTPSPRTGTASRVELLASDVQGSGRVSADAIEKICLQLEMVRSQGYAVRNLNLVSKLRLAVETIGGAFVGVGPHKAVHVSLPDSRPLIVHPAVGVPTALTLHEATTHTPDSTSAVMYDPVGLHPEWQAHLDWLGGQIRTVRWMKVEEAAWRLADWEG